jgi:hypothetical protein
LTYKQDLIRESVMSDLRKTDCISIEKAFKDVGVSRNTLTSYMNALGVTKHKFPFDKRIYISKDDFERIKAFMAENRGEE